MYILGDDKMTDPHTYLMRINGFYFWTKKLFMQIHNDEIKELEWQHH